MEAGVKSAVERALGTAIRSVQRVAGGDINDAFRVQLADRSEVFIKTNPTAPVGLFSAEARGLQWLAQPGVIAIPKVLAVSDEVHAAFLVLEYQDLGEALHNFDEQLGQQLAALHRSGAPHFGFAQDNFIGRLSQCNSLAADWPTFYRDNRLAPQIERAARSGLLDPAMIAKFEILFGRLQQLLGSAEPPARLHGDLWGGNLLVTSSGQPCLIDPAVYGGHREVDLAMMRLFGGFSPRVFDAYSEAYPLTAGASERVDLYQLYPLLVHVNLFGGGYVAGVTRAVQRYV